MKTRKAHNHRGRTPEELLISGSVILRVFLEATGIKCASVDETSQALDTNPEARRKLELWLEKRTKEVRRQLDSAKEARNVTANTTDETV